MALTKEQLLRPRIKIIAGWPLMEEMDLEVGKVYEAGDLGEGGIKYLLDYPHLFRKLEWHDGLKESELPEYVKVNVVGCSVPQGFVYKVCEWGVYPDEGRKWGNEGDFYALYIMEQATKTNDVGERITINIKNLLPSDESEFNSQKQ